MLQKHRTKAPKKGGVKKTSLSPYFHYIPYASQTIVFSSQRAPFPSPSLLMVLRIPLVPGLHNPLIISMTTYWGDILTIYNLCTSSTPSGYLMHIICISLHLLKLSIFHPQHITFLQKLFPLRFFAQTEVPSATQSFRPESRTVVDRSVFFALTRFLPAQPMASLHYLSQDYCSDLPNHPPHTHQGLLSGNWIMSHFLNPSMVSHCPRN